MRHGMLGATKRLVAVGGLVAVAVAAPLPRPAAVPLARQAIESDLRVRAVRVSPSVIPAGTDPWVTAALVNTSRISSYTVVRPGDGSEVGWREPHVFCTATLDPGDGRPRPVTECDYGRCGLFDSNWPRDAVRLKPGEELPLPRFVLPDFQAPGRVRLTVHYAYRAGGPPGRSRWSADRLGRLAGVPAFAVASDPVEFQVVRPLDVRVRVKRSMKAHVKARLSDLLDVTLVNQSGEPVTCSSPTLSANARVELEIRGQFGGWRPALTEAGTGYGVTRPVRPGEAVPLLGPGEFPNGLDGHWEYPVADTVRVRAVYLTHTWTPGACVRSEWAEVRVVP